MESSHVKQSSLHKNAALKAILNIFNLLVPLLVGPYVNALLAPEQLGLYNRALAECQIFYLLGSFGIYNFGVRELSRVRGDVEAVRRTYSALFLWGIITNTVAGILYALFFLTRANVNEWLMYSVLFLQIFSNVFYVEFMNEATENYTFITWKTIAVRALYMLAIFGIVRSAEDGVKYALVISGTILGNNLASYFYVRRKVKLIWRNLNLRQYLWPLFISFLIVNVEVLYAQADRTLLAPYGSYLGNKGDVLVTLYTLPFTLIGMLASVPTALLSVALPRLSNMLGQNDKAGYSYTLQNITEYFFAMLVPLCFGVAAVAEEVMRIYTGDVYTYGWPILVLASFGRLIYGGQFIISSLILYLHKQEKKMSLLLLAGGILNLILKAGLIMTSALTPLTAMAATLAAVVVYIGAAQCLIRKEMQLEWHLFTKRTVGYCLAAATFFPLHYFWQRIDFNYYLRLLGVVVSCVVVYAAYLLVTRDGLISFLLTGKRRQ